ELPQFPLASERILRYCPPCAGIGPRNLLLATPLDDTPARPPYAPHRKRIITDVDNARPEGRSHQDLCGQGRRYRIAGSAGGDPLGAHQQPYRAFQDPRQGQSFAAWTAQARVPAAAASRLSRPCRRSPLQILDRTAGYSPLTIMRGMFARFEADTGTNPLFIRQRGRCRARKTGRMIARRLNGRLEGHGRIAGRCLGLRHGRRPQPLAVLLMAFVPSQIPGKTTAMFDIHRVELDWGGRKLVLETGKIARQAEGAVVATYGESKVLATVVAAQERREGIDFLPLTVDYQEKFYAAGRIPGGYFKREGRPTEKETLVPRLIDRPVAPR